MATKSNTIEDISKRDNDVAAILEHTLSAK